jgi:hypothetical protein
LVQALLLVLGCSHHAEVSTPAPSPAAPTQLAAPATNAAPSTPPGEERPLERERLREPPPPALRDLPRALPEIIGSKPPAFCARLRAGPLSEPRTACGASMVARLAGALDLSDVERRDRALAPLERCDELPTGWLRAVRADLTRPCADVLISPALQALKGPLDADLGETLLALALAARWARAVEQPRPYSGNGTEGSVAQFLAKSLRPWKQRQLAKIEALTLAASQLERQGYGSTIVALARARATHQLYSVARSSPIPTEVKRDYVTRTRYFAGLDSELSDVRARIGPEDARVRDLLFEQGIHRAVDADEWFALQRPDFAHLRIEPPAGVEPSSDTEHIIRNLPSFYVEAVFGAMPLDDPRQLRLLVEHGVTPRQRRAFAIRPFTGESSEILAYFHATLALRTRRLRHFDEVVAWLQQVEPRSAAADLLLATARSGRTGEESQLDAQTGEPTAWLFDVAALRALAENQIAERERAFALNNAAWLSVLANTPDGLHTAQELANRAQAVAPSEVCLVPLYGTGFVREERRPACELPALP